MAMTSGQGMARPGERLSGDDPDKGEEAVCRDEPVPLVPDAVAPVTAPKTKGPRVATVEDLARLERLIEARCTALEAAIRNMSGVQMAAAMQGAVQMARSWAGRLPNGAKRPDGTERADKGRSLLDV